MTIVDQQLAERRANPPANLASAVAALQRMLPEVKKSELAEVKGKTKEGKDFEYTYMYADLAQVTRAIMPLLGEVGLSFIAKPTLTDDGKFVLAYSLLHSSGGREDGRYPLPTAGTPQAIGSAITYARRYCLCAVTGIAPEDDDDAAAAQAHAEETSQAKRGTAQRAGRPQQRQQAPTQERATVQRATRAAAPAGPPLPGEVEPVTEPQLPKVIVMFDKLGITDRTERLDLSSLVVGRELKSARDMTKAEARALIDRLEQASQQDDPTSWLYESVRSDGVAS